MKKCPNCGQLNSDIATTCHSCHCNLNGTPSNNNTSTHGTVSSHNTTTSSYNNQSGNPHSQYGNQTGNPYSAYGNQTGNPYQSGTQPYNMPPNGYTGDQNGGQNGGSAGGSTSKTPANSIVTFLAIGFAIATVFLGIALLNTKSELKTYDTYKQKATILDSCVVFSSDYETYHTLDCQRWDHSSFCVGNPELLEALLEMKPCQYCIGN